MKDYTVEFLRAIAERLSSRENCRKLEYVVYIGRPCDQPGYQQHISDSNTTNVVSFYPQRDVYPDTHHRQRTDLIDIVYHIMRTKFEDTIYDHDDEYGRACYVDGSLTPGVYKYILSFDGKRRHWIRVS